jgi:2-oxoisovalerate dehydrogenase E1 component alpha subunit
VIKNNQWAISVPLEKQTRCQTLAQKAIAAGFQGVQVDGNDIFALHYVLENAIEKARNGEPTLIEAISYRLSDHTTADDATRYQPSHQVEEAKQLIPIERLKKYLLKQNILTQTDIDKIITEAEAEIEKNIDVYLNQNQQKIETIFDYHYAALPDYLIEQRAEAMEEFNHAHD